ncbi:MAG: hypothetical protein K0U98_11035 [Deltaproteobacteria bacterium]|nr:hypothetical protein [Deltaproteobacteria bacterium]
MGKLDVVLRTGAMLFEVTGEVKVEVGDEGRGRWSGEMEKLVQCSLLTQLLPRRRTYRVLRPQKAFTSLGRECPSTCAFEITPSLELEGVFGLPTLNARPWWRSPDQDSSLGS